MAGSAGTVELIAEARARGTRLDAFLASRLTGWSRSRLQAWIREGRVHVDGDAAAPGRRLRGGETIRVQPAPNRPARLQPVPMDLSVLYRDDDLIVVDKPAGLVVHPGAGTHRPTLVHGLLALGVGLSGVGGEERPGIVHRLDRDTSGALVVACNDETHRALSQAFQDRRVRKTYRAICWGAPHTPSGLVDLPIGRDPARRRTMSPRGKRRREARTVYRVTERLGGFSQLELDLLTGRTHQIRAHMKSLGHPVVGDREYGGAGWRGLRDAELRRAIRDLDRLALHAWRLGFEHPRTARPMQFEAPWPAPLEALASAMRRAATAG